MAVKIPEVGLSAGFWSFSLVESSELNKGGAKGGRFVGNRGAVFRAASRGATISVSGSEIGADAGVKRVGDGAGVWGSWTG